MGPALPVTSAYEGVAIDLEITFLKEDGKKRRKPLT